MRKQKVTETELENPALPPVTVKELWDEDPETSTRPAYLSAEYNWCEGCQVAYQDDQCPGCYTPPEGNADTYLPPKVGEPDPEDPQPSESGISSKEIRETLKCILTPDEIRNYGVLCARANAEIQAAEDELQAIKSQFKSRIDRAVATRNECAQKVNNGYEFRPVDCLLVRDFQNNTIYLHRMDNLEVEWSRVMSGDERQMCLV